MVLFGLARLVLAGWRGPAWPDPDWLGFWPPLDVKKMFEKRCLESIKHGLVWLGPAWLGPDWFGRGWGSGSACFLFFLNRFGV